MDNESEMLCDSSNLHKQKLVLNQNRLLAKWRPWKTVGQKNGEVGTSGWVYLFCDNDNDNIEQCILSTLNLNSCVDIDYNVDIQDVKYAFSTLIVSSFPHVEMIFHVKNANFNVNIMFNVNIIFNVEMDKFDVKSIFKNFISIKSVV